MIGVVYEEIERAGVLLLCSTDLTDVCIHPENLEHLQSVLVFRCFIHISFFVPKVQESKCLRQFWITVACHELFKTTG